MKGVFHPKHILLFCISLLIFFSCQKGISYTLDDNNGGMVDSTGNGTDTTGLDTTATMPTDTIGTPGDPVDTIIAGTLAFEESYFLSGNVYNQLHYFSGNSLASQITSDYYPQRKVYYNSAGKMTRIDTYFKTNDGFYYAYSANLVYNSGGHVNAIIQTDSMGTSSDTLYTYEYNSGGQMIEKIEYLNNSVQSDEKYTYNSSGNVVQLQNSNGTFTIEYDTRTNKFNDIHPQYQFLDAAIVFDYTGRNQIFYNSKNYPVKMIANNSDVTFINIELASDGRPATISYDGTKWYSYSYH